MKKRIFLVLALALALVMQAQVQNAAYLKYINEWKETAVQQQKDYGIPASITMAQALLESAAGKSELAVNARNHFGIKCTSDWFGGVYYYDDDSKGECFRQYKDAAESFKDHSVFLQRPRYATCFEIAIEDYEGWAYRLRECGYATDKLYAPKLIKIIEDYRLDTLAAGVKASGEQVAAAAVTAGTVTTTAAAGPAKRPLKAEVVHKTEPIMVVHNDPEPPYVVPPTAKEERDSFMLSHPKKKCNGVAYVEAREGDTYANVAFRLNVKERDLREHNDALGRDMQKGDRIYLAPKKKSGQNLYVWTHVGQSLWQLSQEECVQLAVIQELNGLDPSIRVLRTRQKMYLKKEKGDK
ncbi:MAG: glucosaminidase domain-containing protein [Paludibacteraceae bacterium]|nr:glucosaminidase domain-containing protein [Paludibacteraceae bacterium]